MRRAGFVVETQDKDASTRSHRTHGDAHYSRTIVSYFPMKTNSGATAAYTCNSDENSPTNPSEPVAFKCCYSLTPTPTVSIKPRGPHSPWLGKAGILQPLPGLKTRNHKASFILRPHCDQSMIPFSNEPYVLNSWHISTSKFRVRRWEASQAQNGGSG